MKRKHDHRKKKGLGIPNLYLIGGGFLIAFAVVLFGYYAPYYNENLRSYSFQDLKERYPLVEEVEAYAVIKKLLQQQERLARDATHPQTLDCFSLKQNADLRTFIQKQNPEFLKEEESNYMYSQYIVDIYIWDKDKFPNIQYYTPKEKAELMNPPYDDYWELFHAKYGDYALLKFSTPIFNQAKDKCVLIQSEQGGYFWGSEKFLLLQKVNGQWKVIKEAYGRMS